MVYTVTLSVSWTTVCNMVGGTVKKPAFEMKQSWPNWVWST